MAKQSSNIFGDVLILGVVAVLAMILIRWINNSSASQKQSKGSGTSIGTPGSTSQQGGFSKALAQAFATLGAMLGMSAQSTVGLQTSLPTLNQVIPQMKPALLDMTGFTQPLDVGSILGGFDTSSLMPTDPTLSATIQTQPLQQLDMSSFYFPQS